MSCSVIYLFYRKKVYKKYVYMLFVASNISDGWMTTFTPSCSNQMIRNLSMKIGDPRLLS